MSFLGMMVILGSTMTNMTTLDMMVILAKSCNACNRPKDVSLLEFGII